ncbi:uncharacterized protein [Prorops nasuta]|uniref:uncharacterized protein n=1 Tax=Prorops nasuta TaxID=863751 RepID=UPI0034CEA3A9
MTSILERQIRALSYPEDSEMGIFFALAIPLDDPVSTKAMSVALFFEANYKLPNDFHQETEAGKRGSAKRKRRDIDRTMVYRMLESKFESFGFPGKQCLLRSICDITRQPIHAHNGLFGDLLRIILTPSSSRPEPLDLVYLQAENLNSTLDCEEIYSSCTIGIYDYITHVYPDY